ncbi:hypothetical protein SSX86_008548 [Deinandra increscens subsp. villosa]|uniref:PB1 domain-containing protein n=1 Tax=Deinandra increscens subsp. villosa TaxID=3103831 RepID=A0AAP0DBH4_9ASTR
MMENNNTTYSYPPVYPDSNTSTPRSWEVECETDEHLANPNPNPNPNSHNYKVKLMCSYGGKILPRPHDNQLAYIGGDTKILTVDRNIRYASISNKLNSLTDDDDHHNATCCFKYQLPGEDLDALISVTNDEDLEHMMTEYDRIFRSSTKPVRLRLFLFSLSTTFHGGRAAEENNKAEQQWFVDALNAVRISSSAPPPAASESTDFLFGFDKGNANAPPSAAVVVAHTEGAARLGSECGSEDSNSNLRHVISDPPTTVEIQRQMQQQVAASHEQAVNIDPRAYYGDYYTQKIQPRTTTTYWHDQRHVASTGGGGYQMPVSGADGVYLIPSSTGVYPAAAGRPATQVSQGQGGYYGMQRMVNAPEFYREQAVTQPKVGAYQEAAIGMVRPQAEFGYYYTTSQGGMTPSYQPVVADIRQAGLGTLAVNQEGKMVVNPP